MGLRNMITKWSVRDIARTQFRLFNLARQDNQLALEREIAPLLFMRRMGSFILPKGQQERIDAHTQLHGLPKTLRQACHAIAVIEFKIHPLDQENVALLTRTIDKQLDRLGYAEE